MTAKNKYSKLLAAFVGIFINVLANTSMATETITYYHFNVQGSTVAATNESGQVIWREAYKPFGERIIKTNSRNNQWYTGHSEDPTTSLIYMGDRWYDPVLGRFLGADPAPVKSNDYRTFNRYAYANNSPYVYIDPDGRSAALVIEGIGVATILYFALTEAPGHEARIDTLKQVWAVYNDSGNDSVGDAPGLPDGLVGDQDVAKSATRTKKVEPIKDASGPHTTWKSDPQTGEITRHETWTPNPRNPNGWDKVQSTDITGAPHINKQTGEAVPTPHTQGKNIPGGVRPAEPSEIPNGNHYNW